MSVTETITSAQPDALVVLVHGVGQDGLTMMAVADQWRDVIPHVVFAAPDAPTDFERARGKQWFSVADLSDANRPGRVAAARSLFDRAVRDEIAKHGFTDRLDRIGFVGFSQGAMMVIDAVVTGRWPVASAVAIGGRLTAVPPFASECVTRLLFLLGAADRLVPSSELDRATTVLERAGFAIDGLLFPDIGHEIAPALADAALEFIQDCFPAKRAGLACG